MEHADATAEMEEITNKLAVLFLNHIFGRDEEKLGEWYWIGNDPAGTLAFGDYYFSLSDIYETLKHSYDPNDFWNYYHYSTEYIVDYTQDRIGLWHFIRLYKGYTGALDTLAKTIHDDNNKKKLFWDSPEGLAKDKEIMDTALAQFQGQLDKLNDSK